MVDSGVVATQVYVAIGHHHCYYQAFLVEWREADFIEIQDPVGTRIMILILNDHDAQINFNKIRAHPNLFRSFGRLLMHLFVPHSGNPISFLLHLYRILPLPFGILQL